MTDQQIKQLDRCREEQKKLSDVQNQVRELFKSIGNNHNANLGEEINQIFADMKQSVNKTLGDAQTEIHKLITNI